MKVDEVKGGIKVFTEKVSDGEYEEEASLRSYSIRLRRNKSEGGVDRRKRKNWSPPEIGNIQPLNCSKIDQGMKGTEMKVEGRKSEELEKAPDIRYLSLENDAPCIINSPNESSRSSENLPPESSPERIPPAYRASTVTDEGFHRPIIEAQYRMQSIGV